jgi:hypothetical protein
VSTHLAAIALSAVAVNPSWTPTLDAEFENYGPFSVASDGTGQLSSGMYTIVVRTTGLLQVNYSAPREHCSSLRMHFLVDGLPKATSDVVAPGRSSGYVELGPVEAGEHQLSLQAEGVPGGCNAGFLTSWGGSAMVYTSHPPFDAALGIDAIDAGCGGGVTGEVWNVHIGSDGTVTRSAYGPGRYPLRGPLQYHVPVEQVRALFERARSAGLMTLQLEQRVNSGCTLTLSAGAARHTLSWETDPKSPQAKEIFDAAVSMAPLHEYDR